MSGLFADDLDLDGARIPLKAFLTGPDGIRLSTKSYERHRKAGLAPEGLLGASCRRTFSPQEYAEYHTCLALRATKRQQAAHARREANRARAITHQTEAGDLYRLLRSLPQGAVQAVAQIIRRELASRGVTLTDH